MKCEQHYWPPSDTRVIGPAKCPYCERQDLRRQRDDAVRLLERSLLVTGQCVFDEWVKDVGKFLAAVKEEGD